jgi:hypothetical protein
LLEISPELVLVDPDLAAIARLRLAEDAAAREALSSAPEPRPVAARVALPRRPSTSLQDRATAVARASVERTTPTLLFVSLLLNLVFAASLFAGNSDAPTLEPGPPAVTALQLSESTKTVPVARTKAEAERTVLALAQQGARGRAPKLLDPDTGLLKNNVQSVCRDAGGGSLLCVVSAPHHRPGEGLYVRYRPENGSRSAAITWLGYRISD